MFKRPIYGTSLLAQQGSSLFRRSCNKHPGAIILIASGAIIALLFICSNNLAPTVIGETKARRKKRANKFSLLTDLKI
jgi:hypothetical protein